MGLLFGKRDHLLFQSTLPRGERRAGMFLLALVAKFQSTLPRGERRCIQHAEAAGKYISIHAPARGATFTSRDANCCCRYFNPRSREGSDYNLGKVHGIREISIHAPARGATKCLAHMLFQCNISIHAPARGATRISGMETAIPMYFNPRSREGSDAGGAYNSGAYIDFNPRSREGSDGNTAHMNMWVGDFNPRSREGSDGDTERLIVEFLQFQSTLPRGERRCFR